jgi:hypothetical protein
LRARYSSPAISLLSISLRKQNPASLHSRLNCGRFHFGDGLSSQGTLAADPASTYISEDSPYMRSERDRNEDALPKPAHIGAVGNARRIKSAARAIVFGEEGGPCGASCRARGTGAAVRRQQYICWSPPFTGRALPRNFRSRFHELTWLNKPVRAAPILLGCLPEGFGTERHASRNFCWIWAYK